MDPEFDVERFLLNKSVVLSSISSRESIFDDEVERSLRISPKRYTENIQNNESDFGRFSD
jgi:hypothetical protein